MSGCVGIGSRHMAHSGERIRFSVFADIHYMPGVFPNDTPAHLDKVLGKWGVVVCDKCAETRLHVEQLKADKVGAEVQAS